MNPAFEIKNEVDQHLILVLRIVIYTVGNIFIYTVMSSHRISTRFFSQRVVRPWNELPKEVREAENSQSFKRKLRTHREKEQTS